MIDNSKLDKATQKEIRELAGTLNEILPQIEVIVSYFDMVSLNFGSKKDFESLATLHYALFQDKSLSSVTGMLNNLRNTVDDVSYALYGADQ